MNNVATKNKNSYNEVLRIFKKTRIAWMQLETGKTSTAPKIVIEKLLDTLEKLIKSIDKINISSLRTYYPQETINKIKANLGAHKDQAQQLNKKVLAMKYFDAISPKIGGYVQDIDIGEGEIREFGSKYNLMQTFLSRVLHPHNIREFKPQLESLSKGTMTLPSFRRWFRNTMFPTGMPSKEQLSPKEKAEKYGHPESWRRAKDEFQSYTAYNKEQSEKQANIQFHRKKGDNNE